MPTPTVPLSEMVASARHATSVGLLEHHEPDVAIPIGSSTELAAVCRTTGADRPGGVISVADLHGSQYPGR